MFWKQIYRQSTIYSKPDLIATSESVQGIDRIAQKVRAIAFWPVKSDHDHHRGTEPFIVLSESTIGLTFYEFGATISSFHTS
jgi:hypothetical protein